MTQCAVAMRQNAMMIQVRAGQQLNLGEESAVFLWLPDFRTISNSFNEVKQSPSIRPKSVGILQSLWPLKVRRFWPLGGILLDDQAIIYSTPHHYDENQDYLDCYEVWILRILNNSRLWSFRYVWDSWPINLICPPECYLHYQVCLLAQIRI